MRLRWLALAPVLALQALHGCQATGPADAGAFPTELDQFTTAGEMTVYDATSAAYSLPAPGLSPASLADHVAGDRAFAALYVSAPAPVNPGLGPVYNNNSCLACHKGDGGGRAPEDGGSSNTMLFRLSVPGAAPDGGPAPVPGFGGQLQDNALFGVEPEARVVTRYEAVTGAFADGTPYALRRPRHALTAPYKPLPADVMISPRLTPPVFGLGLLEAVPEAAIRAMADEHDRDGDGVSGRPNVAWDAKEGAPKLGRFGWKANTPTLPQQVQAAFQQDMGLTSPLFPAEASAGQPQAPQAPQAPAGTDGAAGAPPELSEETVRTVVAYVRTLGAPARRNVDDAGVRRGAALFKANCAVCHAPTLKTGPFPEEPALAYQVFHPYTDLLLHDMGPDLADDRPDYLASGSEWRTAPLWGVGLRKRVQGAEHLLHDGRANGVQEAILWHGGEAEKAREAFKAMGASDRAALLAFLNSL